MHTNGVAVDYAHMRPYMSGTAYRLRKHERLIIVVEVPNGHAARSDAYARSLGAQLLVVNFQRFEATIRLQRQSNETMLNKMRMMDAHK